MVVSARLDGRRDRSRSAGGRDLSHRDDTPAGGAPVAVSGQFVEVDPPDRLVYTWCWEGAFTEMPPTLVSLQLEGSAEETLLTLRHENFVDVALRHQHRSGWISACDRLDRLVTPPTMLGAQPAAK